MNPASAAVSAVPEPALPAEIDELPVPYLEIDAQGRITRANRTARDLHLPDHGEMIGKCVWDMIAFDQKVLSAAAFSAQIHSGVQPPVITRSVLDRSGSFRTYQLHRRLMRDAAGKPVGMSMVGIDVTEVTDALEEALHARHWLECAMASVPDGVVLTDALGVVRALNPAAENIFGFPSTELAGKVIEEAVPLLNYQPDDGVSLNRRNAIERRCSGTATLLCCNRRLVKVRMNTAPVSDQKSGSVIGVVAFLRKLD